MQPLRLRWYVMHDEEGEVAKILQQLIFHDESGEMRWVEVEEVFEGE